MCLCTVNVHFHCSFLKKDGYVDELSNFFDLNPCTALRLLKIQGRFSVAQRPKPWGVDILLEKPAVYAPPTKTNMAMEHHFFWMRDTSSKGWFSIVMLGFRVVSLCDIDFLLWWWNKYFKVVNVMFLVNWDFVLAGVRWNSRPTMGPLQSMYMVSVWFIARSPEVTGK